MLVPTRHGQYDPKEKYRYGFQGQEKDDEIKGGEGNSLNYTYRMHDPRIGRFFTPDPLEPNYPFFSPYQFSANTPIMAVELEGLESSCDPNVNQQKNHRVEVDENQVFLWNLKPNKDGIAGTGYLKEVVVYSAKKNSSTVNSSVSAIDFRKEIIPSILNHEKGYQNFKKDNGNWTGGKKGKGILVGTNHGISAPVLMQHIGRLPTVEDMKNLTEENAIEIYETRYWNKPRMPEVKNKQNLLQYNDMYVNGEGGAVIIMKRALNNLGYNLKINYVINDKYIKAINEANQESLHREFKIERIKFYENLIEKDPTQEQFRASWMNRSESFKY